MISIERSIAADDSCQQMLYARGHFDTAEFLEACKSFLKSWHGKECEVSGPVIQLYWRTVKASWHESSICDFVFRETKKGRGAFAVTILDVWLPIFW